MKIVKNMNTLKSMNIKGLIEIHNDTKKFSYVNEGKSNFEFKNKKYKTIYLDGCFFPFVFEVN